jgi:hypothetical protein
MNIFSGAFMVRTRFAIRIMGILVRIWCKKKYQREAPAGVECFNKYRSQQFE